MQSSFGSVCVHVCYPILPQLPGKLARHTDGISIMFGAFKKAFSLCFHVRALVTYHG